MLLGKEQHGLAPCVAADACLVCEIVLSYCNLNINTGQLCAGDTQARGC